MKLYDNTPSSSKGCRLHDEGGAVVTILVINNNIGCCGNNIAKIKVKIMKIKDRLLRCGLVRDNEYLDRYIDVVQTRSVEKKQIGVHNKHHIIPRFYYRNNKIPIDNSSENIAFLTFKDHIVAHYYLALCADEKYKAPSDLAFLRTSGFMKIPESEEAIHEIINYDDIYQSYIESLSKKMLGHVMSDEAKRKISLLNTGKRRTKEERERIAEATRAATTDEMRKKNSEFHKGTVWVNDGVHSKQVRPQQVNEFLQNGWVNGRTKFKQEAVNAMTKANRKIAERIKGKIRYVNDGNVQKYITLDNVDEFLKNNPDWHLGQLPKPQFIGSKIMNNGTITKQIRASEIDLYLSNGWNIGRFNKECI